MSGHGWVTPNPDGSKARCGGPAICVKCALEFHREFRINQVGVARPGDIILITSSRRITDAEFHNMQGRFKELFPELRLCLFEGATMEVSIIRPGEEGQAVNSGEAAEEAAGTRQHSAADPRQQPPVLPRVVRSQVGGAWQAPGQESQAEISAALPEEAH